MERMKSIFKYDQFLLRLKKYVTFLELADDFNKRKDLMVEAELLLMIFEKISTVMEKSSWSHIEQDRFKDFRNYLAHEKELGEKKNFF
jgi:hypothetical protein